MSFRGGVVSGGDREIGGRHAITTARFQIAQAVKLDLVSYTYMDETLPCCVFGSSLTACVQLFTMD